MPRVSLNNSLNLPPVKLTEKPAGTKIGKQSELLSYYPSKYFMEIGFENKYLYSLRCFLGSRKLMKDFTQTCNHRINYA